MVVFVCGTYADLSAERDAVLAVIRQLQHRHHAMEFFGARPGRPIETCLEEVRASDILVVVIGNLYGSLVPGTEISYTEAEYNEGYRLDKKCLVYVRGEDALIPVRYMEQDPSKIVRLRSFRALLADRHTIVRFHDAGDLAQQVGIDLARLAEKIARPNPPDGSTAPNAEQVVARYLRIAADVQRELLPKRLPAIEGLDIAAQMLSWQEIGGDYYDFFTSEAGEIGIVIADVAGKGIPAALIMATFQAQLRLLAEETPAPAALITRLNAAASKNMPRDRFVSLFFTILNVRDGTMVYCNAGHNPPMIAREDGSVERLSGGGPIVGFIHEAKYEEHTARLNPGDALLLYTDGIPEYENAAGDEFGEDRLAAVLRDCRERSAEAMLEALLAALRRWAAGTPARDDLTSVVVRRV